MPIQIPNPPAAAVDVVRQAIRSFAEKSTFRTPALRGAQTERLTLSEPSPVYVLGLSDLRTGAGLARAQLVAWRHLVQEGGKVIASADSTSAVQGATHLFSHFNEGPFVSSLAAAIEMVRADPQIAGNTYEQRLLHVPALYFMALWLHEQSGANDLMVPLAPTPSEVPAGQILPANELLGKLAELAQRVPNEQPNSATGS